MNDRECEGKKIEAHIKFRFYLDVFFLFKYTRTMENSLCLLLLPHFLFIPCSVPSCQAIIPLEIVSTLSLSGMLECLFQRWHFEAPIPTALNLWGK